MRGSVGSMHRATRKEIPLAGMMSGGVPTEEEGAGMERRWSVRGPLHAGLLGLVAAVLVIVGLLGMHALTSGGSSPHAAHMSASAAMPCAATECAGQAPCTDGSHAAMCTPLPPHDGPALSPPTASGATPGFPAAAEPAGPHRSPPPIPPSLHELSILRI